MAEIFIHLWRNALVSLIAGIRFIRQITSHFRGYENELVTKTFQINGIGADTKVSGS
jgi:hypothetical protein